MKTQYGLFWQFDFFVNDDWEKYSVLVKGDLDEDFNPIFSDKSKIALRVDSGCETGQKFKDMTCDCNDQLMLVMQEIEKIGEGIIINIPNQDGRGMGLNFKLATLLLQETLKLNTVESASVLTKGGMIDKRTYGGVIAVLNFFQVSKKSEILLATNNPEKFSIFIENGYRAIKRLPMIVSPNLHTRRHLEAKQLYLGHRDLVSPSDKKEVYDEDYDQWFGRSRKRHYC